MAMIQEAEIPKSEENSPQLVKNKTQIVEL